MDQSLRLRLIVRRHGLPEARILFNVPLENDPTVAQLLELVNESIPLESDDWGLDDYAVELHAKDGHAFECLHFQPVASILEKDDEIFIRPLLTNDLKKRRISGRDQISSGGQHLIDGVPFGRPRLRAPRGRPAVHIAPRKRRRLAYDGDFDQDDIDDDDDQGDADPELAEQFLVSGNSYDDEDEDQDEPLLLTQHGEPQTRKDKRRVHFPRSVTATAEFEDTDSHGGSSEAEEDTEVEDEQDEDMFEPDPEDLREELSGLAEEAADTRRGEIIRDSAVERPSVPAEVNDFGPFTEEDSDPEASNQFKRPKINSRNRSSHDVSDKVIAVRSAFPAVSGDVCEKLLANHNYDVGSAWKKLAQQLKPRLDLAQTMVLNTQLELPKEVMVISSPPRDAAGAPGGIKRIGDEEDDATDGSSSGDEDEEEEDYESEVHTTSAESEDTEGSDSDSDSDACAEDTPAPRTAPDADDTDSSSSSSDGSGSNDDDESEAEARPAIPGNRAKGANRTSSSENQSTRLRNRPRRNVIESSPASSQTRNTKSGASPGKTTVPARIASPLESTESSSSESDSDDQSEDDSEESQSDSSNSSSDLSSSSDSSSDSESESDVAAPSMATGMEPAQSTNATPSSAQARTKSTATQSSVQKSVAPGQGMSKTQRRNARRRIQMAAQRASQSVEKSQAPAAKDDDLLAKKQALLESLGVSMDAPKHCGGSAANERTATSLGNPPKNPSKSEEDPDAWRKKVSYRAVECFNEGVDLSEPPFPFVQRWDSSTRRGKRKSRDDSQFYDGTNQSTKKQKLGQLPRQHADSYGNSDDIMLNYDDEPVGLAQGKIAVDNTRTEQTAMADEDDLPSLSADMSLLPQLSSDGIQPGLIVAWKQLLLTKATNWEPQLSNFMTAVVTEVDDGGNLRVQLAKRDRHVDKNEKEYDDEGGRVYAKFEVPDDDEEEEEEEADLGFRHVSFAEMIDPRIVWRPSDSTTETKISQPQDVEVADSQRGRRGGTSNNPTSNSDQSKTMDVDSISGPITGEQSFVSETNHDVVADVGAEPDDIPPQDVSISEERRDEISQLINEGGFRQGVRTSLDQLNFLQFGSPSRQLEEEASSMLPSRQLQSAHRSSSEAASEEAPSEYGSKDPSQQEAHLAAAVPVLDDSHSALQAPSQSGANTDAEHVEGEIEYPKLNSFFTSQASVRSGRQIDPDFVSHSDDLGHGDDSAMMNSFDDDDVPSNDFNPKERSQVDRGHQERTPVHEVYNNGPQEAQDAMEPLSPLRAARIGPGGNDRPTSAGSASTGSSSIFVDFELLGSQPVTTKFKEHIKGESFSQATQGMAGLPDINEAPHVLANARLKSPESGRNQSVDGTPVSQRSRVLTRSSQQSLQDANDEESVSQRTRRSSRLMGSASSPPVATKAATTRKTKQHITDGSPTPNGNLKSLVASFEAPVSPPALSKPRREPSRTPSRSQRG